MPLRFMRGGIFPLLLTVIALGASVALVCAIDLANRAVYSAFSEILDTMAGRAALQVSAGGGALFEESVARSIAKVPGVELAVPVVSSWAFTTDGTKEQLTVHGIDIANDAVIRTYEPAGGRARGLEEPLAFLNQPDSVMLTEAFAARHGLALNDAVAFDTPTGRKQFVIRALLAPKGIARIQGGNLLVMDIAAAERAFTKDGLVNRIDVVVDRDAHAATVRDGITSVLPAGLRVEAPEQRRLDLHSVVQSIQILLQAVSLFGLFAAFLIAFSRLSTVFEARMGQLAVLRAVGVRADQVWWELIKESLLVAIAGIAVGIPAGIGLGHAIVSVVATATSLGAKLVAADAELTVRPASLLLAVASGMTAVFLAALVPARRAAHLSITQTLRWRDGKMDADRPNESLARHAVLLAVATGVTALIHVYTTQLWAGFTASALLVITAAIATRPILAALANPLLRLSTIAGGAVPHYAVAGLLAARRRTALTVAMLGIGFGTVLWLWTLAGSFERSLINVIPGVLRGDLSVSSVNVAVGYVEAPLDGAILEEIAAVPGVGAVVGEQAADWHYKNGPIALDAFDPAYFSSKTFGEWPAVEFSVSLTVAFLCSMGCPRSIRPRSL